MHPGQHVANRLPISRSQVAGSGQSAHTTEVRQVSSVPTGSVSHQLQTVPQGMGSQRQGNSLGQIRTNIPPQQDQPVSTHTQYNHTAVRGINQVNLHVLPGVAPAVGLSNLQSGASYQQIDLRGLPINGQTDQQDIIVYKH